MKLLIVESPTKCRTLEKFLGKDYQVAATMGHFRDLPKKELGVDTEHDFVPKYVIAPGKKKIVDGLKKESAKAEEVYLSTDPDREGEAIAWHVAQVLNLSEVKSKKLKVKSYKRIVFHEITKSAIQGALKKPRKIDMDLVDAQQARRILDRLVGYKLSPFLWRKISRGLSAGRVQSVAVRLVVDREREIESFKPREYWSVEAELQQRETDAKFTRHNFAPQIWAGKRETDAKKEFSAKLVKKDGKAISKLGIKTKKEAEGIVKDLKGAEYEVVKVEKKEVKRNPLPPFTTSALQQEAWKKFKFPAKLTMGVAQSLYEKGLTTYHRTDSVNVANQALVAAQKVIEKNYGKDYWAGFFRKYKTKSKTAQEAHEAIRPSYPAQTPEEVKMAKKLDDRQSRLYDIIWRRFIASQMQQARFDSTVVDVGAGKYMFRSSGQVLKFDGFLKVYPMKFEEASLPPLQEEEILELVKLIPSQHFTQPPSRYSEATLIKTLEENGIGRPSTYAPTISTIQDRNYIKKDEKRRFQPTEIGLVVNDLLVEHFPKIVDIAWTAEMEEDLDKIAHGKRKWVPTVREFYKPFIKNLEEKDKKIKKMVIETKQKCDECGKPMVIRMGRFGKFLACSGFPNCKKTKPLDESGGDKRKPDKVSQEKCDKCGADMVVKRSRFGEFLGCSKYPECKNIKNIDKKVGMKCPDCDKGDVVERRTRTGRKFWGCNTYPKCKYATWEKPTDKKA